MGEKIVVAVGIIALIVMVYLQIALQKENKKKVFLPDGAGYYIKNAELTQEFVNSVPAGETILCYGDMTVRGTIIGKGVNKTILKDMQWPPNSNSVVTLSRSTAL